MANLTNVPFFIDSFQRKVAIPQNNRGEKWNIILFTEGQKILINQI